MRMPFEFDRNAYSEEKMENVAPLDIVGIEDDIILKHPANNCDMCGNKHCIAINSFTSTIFITTPVVYQKLVHKVNVSFLHLGL